MKTQFGLHFGALADDLSDQIKSQGFKFDEKQIKAFQDNVDSLLKLRFADLVNDSQHEKIQRKLYKRIVSHVCKINKLKVNDINPK